MKEDSSIELNSPHDSDNLSSEMIVQEKDGNQTTIVTSSEKTGQQPPMNQNKAIDDNDLLSIYDFRNNDIKILSLLNQEAGSNYSFKGLMRQLNLHQQSLTKSLRRLEGLELIDKSDIGYRLSKTGQMILSKNSSNLLAECLSGIREKGNEKYSQLFQIRVPISIEPREIAYTLIGKRFNNIRWSGLIESEIGCYYVLRWISDDNSFQINLRATSDNIIIEANPVSCKEKIEAMIGSYRIFEPITRILQGKVNNTRTCMLSTNICCSQTYTSNENN
jgi:DNA-binding MarR family transcriptional regulator